MTAATLTRIRLTRPAAALWRSPGVLQVGLDSPALVLEGVPRGLDEAVALLSRPCTTAELDRLLPAIDRPWLAWLVQRLSDAGLLVELPAEAPASLLVVGGGALTVAVTAALAGCGVAATRLDPVDFVLRAPADEAELVVLAGSAAEPDRATTDALFRAGRTHLLVRLEPDRAVVGPFVQPGRTPCVRCVDLARVHLDPAWPHLLAQLCRQPVPPERTLLAWAAATAVVQVRSWLAGGVPETCGAALELSLPDYRLCTRDWPAHPGCGCLVPPG